MIYFECDYNEGCHPRILEAMGRTNLEQTPGYGEDAYCEQAARRIRALCGAPEADVHFLVGGTQANLTVISAALKPYQGAVGAESAHINVHETGAVEATGHKVLTLPSQDGKIQAAQVKEMWERHIHDSSFEHMVQPGLVYISHPTEYGTIYSRRELEELHQVCRECGLYLYLDGARLAYALGTPENDVDFQDLARLCDVFYIGGTKAGALFGEAVVITNDQLKKDFRYSIKQRGGMLAKGRLLGIQFEELLRDGLYQEMGARAVGQMERIRQACRDKGYEFLVDSPTNQIFPLIPEEDLKTLSQKYIYSHMGKYDQDRSLVRFCTSWATRDEDVESLAEDIRRA